MGGRSVKHAVASILVAAGTITAGASVAVAAPAPSAILPSSTPRLAEVIVTAEKRKQSLQSVPAAVTVIGAGTLRQQHITTFSGLAQASGSLTITENTSSPNNSINLRGIGTYAFSIGVEPSVSVILDGVPLLQQAQAFANLSDIHQIQVLPGPQGTLFGKGSSAGVIDITTKDPTRRFSAGVQVTAASDGGYDGNAYVSGAVGRKAALRLSGYDSVFSGNVRNLYDGRWLNDHHSSGFRGKFLVHPVRTLKVMLEAAYSRETQGGTSNTLRYVDNNVTPALLGILLAPDLSGITPGSGNYRVSVDADAPTKNEQATFSARETLDLGWGDLISETTWQDWRYNFVNDVDQTSIDILGVFTNGAVHGGIVQSGPYHATQFTQELRLVSALDGPLQYVTGLWYANGKTLRSFQRGPIIALADWSAEAGSRSSAAFGQLTYRLSKTTSATAGLRVDNEGIDVGFDNLLAGATAASCGTGTECVGSHTDTAVTWKASLQHNFTRAVMAYISAASGYKGYGYNIETGFTPYDATHPVRPEHSRSYEIGVKSRLLSDRLQLNGDIYWTDYTGFQAQTALIVNGAPQLSLQNVGRLRTRGAELQMLARPTNWLLLDGSASYTDAVILSFQSAPCYAGQIAAEGCINKSQNRSGGMLPNSPKFKVDLGGTAHAALADGFEGTGTLDYRYQSAVNFDLLGDPYDVQGGYGIWDANLGLLKGGFTATVFVNNLLDKHYAAYITDSAGLTNTHVLYQVLPRNSQRYFGITIGYRY